MIDLIDTKIACAVIDWTPPSTPPCSAPAEAVMAKKLCEICGTSPATVPIWTWPGRLINRVCGRCHGLWLAKDVREIMRLHEQRRQRTTAREGGQ
jgi:hypothetical protein